MRREKSKEIKGRRTKEGKNKKIYNNHILIINKRLIRKVYQIHKSHSFFSDCACLTGHLF